MNFGSQVLICQEMCKVRDLADQVSFDFLMWLVLFPEGQNSSAIPTSGFQLLQQEEEREKKQVHYRCAGHKEDGTGDAP
jgi:hypothetical protein